MASRALELSKRVMKPICRPSIVCEQNKEYFAHLCTSFLKMFVDSAVMIQYKYLNCYHYAFSNSWKIQVLLCGGQPTFPALKVILRFENAGKYCWRPHSRELLFGISENEDWSWGHRVTKRAKNKGVRRTKSQDTNLAHQNLGTLS